MCKNYVYCKPKKNSWKLSWVEIYKLCLLQIKLNNIPDI